MCEIEKNQLLHQVSVILEQCRMIVSRLSSSDPVCQCQSSTPSSDHNDNFWWDGYTSQLSLFKSEFYSLLSPNYDDLFNDCDDIIKHEIETPTDTSNTSSGVSMLSSITSSYEQECNTKYESKCHPANDPFQTKMLMFLSTSCPSDIYIKTWREDQLRSALIDPNLFPLWINCHWLFQDVLEKDENINVAEFSPEIKYCSIDLQNVNARFIGNIPKPSYVPIQGVSQDPDLYHKLYPRNDYYQVQRYYKFNEPHPFGSAYGYETDVGIVPPPTDPVHGYVWKGGGWVLHAVMPGDRSSSTKRRRG